MPSPRPSSASNARTRPSASLERGKQAITLEFTGYRVAISGRKFDAVFRGILAQVIGHVQEVDELADKATGDPKEAAVYKVGWERI